SKLSKEAIFLIATQEEEEEKKRTAV
ncbi:hypothetical protein AVEN_214169-1, partial [Araneus ventricosus]